MHFTPYSTPSRCASASAIGFPSTDTDLAPKANTDEDCEACDSNSFVNNSSVQNGINYLHSFRHPNIIRLLGKYGDSVLFCFVLCVVCSVEVLGSHVL